MHLVPRDKSARLYDFNAFHLAEIGAKVLERLLLNECMQIAKVAARDEGVFSESVTGSFFAAPSELSRSLLYTSYSLEHRQHGESPLTELRRHQSPFHPLYRDRYLHTQLHSHISGSRVNRCCCCQSVFPRSWLFELQAPATRSKSM